MKSNEYEVDERKKKKYYQESTKDGLRENLENEWGLEGKFAYL